MGAAAEYEIKKFVFAKPPEAIDIITIARDNNLEKHEVQVERKHNDPSPNGIQFNPFKWELTFTKQL